MSRYLQSCWVRAGVPGSSCDDCTQSVLAEFLEEFGRPGFDAFLESAERSGVSATIDAMPGEGRALIRAIDRVRKRARRLRRPPSFVDMADPRTLCRGEAEKARRRADLREAIGLHLDTREADLIGASLHGEKVGEIASRWGIDHRAVSNQKNRAIRKLRVALAN